jgi:gluconolactonase
MPASTYVRPTVWVPPAVSAVLQPQPPLAPSIPPAHVVDLMTEEGSAAFGAQWRVKEAKLVECPALTNSLPEFKTTYDVEPHAELLGFDDSDWAVIPPADLGARRGGGLVSFIWFRATLTIPANAAGFDTAGAKAVFHVNVDDYAEVWINGAMPRTPGRPSPGAIQGFNMPNRVVLVDGVVSPGDRFEIAVFAINGPISAAPGNFLFVREAKVEFFR